MKADKGCSGTAVLAIGGVGWAPGPVLSAAKNLAPINPKESKFRFVLRFQFHEWRSLLYATNTV